VATTLRVATWNINSLRLRLGLLDKLIGALNPDVICLQETKVPDALFPLDTPGALGYPHFVYRGMKGYNGVAILSRVPLTPRDGDPDWCAKGDCRHLGVTLALPSGPLELHNFYVPAGGDIPDRTANPKYAHKLDFVAEATAWFRSRLPFTGAILVGDLNIAPLEHDVWSHRQLLDVVSHTPAETEGLTAWLQTGFTDAIRHFVPADHKHYTWWSYRNKDWRGSDRGRRLDHIWITPDLLGRLQQQITLKDARDWQQTSDHVPVCIALAA
jgi:exodeoxyribonuclease-3